MRNLLFEISYNGSRYHGWQVQQNAITVQQVAAKREMIYPPNETIEATSPFRYPTQTHKQSSPITKQSKIILVIFGLLLQRTAF